MPSKKEQIEEASRKLTTQKRIARKMASWTKTLQAGVKGPAVYSNILEDYDDSLYGKTIEGKFKTLLKLVEDKNKKKAEATLESLEKVLAKKADAVNAKIEKLEAKIDALQAKNSDDKKKPPKVKDDKEKKPPKVKDDKEKKPPKVKDDKKKKSPKVKDDKKKKRVTSGGYSIDEDNTFWGLGGGEHSYDSDFSNLFSDSDDF